MKIDNKTIYYSGNNRRQHWNEVGIIVSEGTEKCTKNVVYHSDRMLLLQLHGSPFNINIIQVYAPKTDKPDTKIEEFYGDLQGLNDLNAKVGKGRSENIIGEHGLGQRNERSVRLFQFCQEQNITIMNAWFKLPARRLYTWKSPQENNKHCVRNQMDYIMINQRYRNSIQSAITYPGADVPSDHTLLVAKFKNTLKSIKRKKTEQKSDMSLLKDIETRQKISQELNHECRELKNRQKKNDVPEESDDLNQIWKELKIVFLKAEDHLKYTNQRGKKPWITNKILEMMNVKRQHKNKDWNKYKEIQRLIRKKIVEAKAQWLVKTCEEIKDLQNKHDDRLLHKKIKEMCGIRNARQCGTITSPDDRVLTTIEEISVEWSLEEVLVRYKHDAQWLSSTEQLKKWLLSNAPLFTS
ncbi:uncharacterized protein [Diabrotica undecimpunctata]|uniref:uncharacterized protein n=1 Tax=Diabrotica undecimpunctata TaxID=50387 RepID=UPI003B63CB9E